MSINNESILSDFTRLFLLILLYEKPAHGYGLRQKYKERLGKSVSFSIIYPYLNKLEGMKYVIAESVMIGQKEKALATYFKILELEKELGHKAELAQTHYQIGGLYESREDFENAKKHYYLSLEIAKEIGSLVDTRDAYGQLMEIYKTEKNFEKALWYNQMYLVLNDSIFNAEKSRQIKEIETQYETKKKEQQIKNLENEQLISDLKFKKQRIFAFSFFMGFVSIFVFLLVLFYQIRKIRKAKNLLAFQKKQITDSIEYASRIQTAVLPPGEYISKLIPEHFIFLA